LLSHPPSIPGRIEQGSEDHEARVHSRKYMDLIGELRKARPGIAVTSDVMVGFPGETEEEFELTLDLIRTIEFDNLFSFKYSDREELQQQGWRAKFPNGKN